MTGRRRAVHKTAAVFLAAVVSCATSSLTTLASDTDPPVPPGKPIGGMPVALVGDGIDYREVGLADRLARDGEGEIIGFDFAGDDRRPFSRAGTGANDAAHVVLHEGQATSLIAVRTDARSPLPFSKALNFAGRSPAAIIVVEQAITNLKSLAALRGAARFFYDRLFIVAAGDDSRDLDQDWPERMHDLLNVIVVAGASPSGVPGPAANQGASTIDVSTDGLPGVLGGSTEAEAGLISSRIAAARIGALAARLRAVEPAIPATAMKLKIVALAKPLASNGRPKAAKYGFLERPMRHFWLE